MPDLLAFSKLKAFYKLSASSKRYVLEAWIKLVQVRVMLYIKPVICLKVYRQTSVRRRKTASVPELTYAIQLAAAYVPGVTCLVQALAAKALLASYGHKVDLRIGVSQANGFKAHAWLELENRIILGDIENLSEYHILQGGVMKA